MKHQVSCLLAAEMQKAAENQRFGVKCTCALPPRSKKGGMRLEIKLLKALARRDGAAFACYVVDAEGNEIFVDGPCKPDDRKKIVAMVTDIITTHTKVKLP